MLFDTGKTFGIVPGMSHFQPRDSIGTDTLPLLDVGTAIDAQDSTGHWLKARVCENSGGDSVRVHFIGWATRYDETITISTERLAHCGTRAERAAASLKPKREDSRVPAAEKQNEQRKKPRLEIEVQQLVRQRSTSDVTGDQSNTPSVCTPVGRVTLGDCLLVNTASRDDDETFSTAASTRIACHSL